MESRGFLKRLCSAIAKQDRDDMTQKLNRSLHKFSAFRRHQMVVWFIESFVHRHGGTVVNGPTHIGGDPSKKQVDLRIHIGELFVDGDVHIHNPTSGNNTTRHRSQ